MLVLSELRELLGSHQAVDVDIAREGRTSKGIESRQPTTFKLGDRPNTTRDSLVEEEQERVCLQTITTRTFPNLVTVVFCRVLTIRYEILFISILEPSQSSRRRWEGCY